jgi:histidine ammonia-lyase
LRSVVRNVETVLAVELLCAAQGIDFLAPLRPGKGSSKAHELIRQHVPTLEEDRMISKDISEIVSLIQESNFIDEVGRAIV